MIYGEVYSEEIHITQVWSYYITGGHTSFLVNPWSELCVDDHGQHWFVAIM